MYAARFVTGNHNYETGSMTGQLKWEPLNKKKHEGQDDPNCSPENLLSQYLKVQQVVVICRLFAIFKIIVDKHIKCIKCVIYVKL